MLHRFSPLFILLLLGLLTPAFSQAQVPAVITAVTPASFPAGSQPAITIAGEGFSPGGQTLLQVNGAFWTMRVLEQTTTTITFVPPSYLSPGSYPLIIRTGNVDCAPHFLTVLASAPGPEAATTPTRSTPQPRPYLTAIHPASLAVGTSQPVTVEGNFFTSTTQALLKISNAYSGMRTIASSPHHLTFVVPATLPSGNHMMVVRNEAGDSNALALAITSPVPTIAPFPSYSPYPTPSPLPNRLRYVALGDSLVLGFYSTKGYVTHFREYLVQQTQSPVDLLNLGRIGWTSSDLRLALETNASFRQQVAQGNVITWNIGGNDVRRARALYKRRQCGGTDNQQCLRQAAAELRANFTAITAQLQALPGQPKIIRALDVYNPYVDEDMRGDTWPGDAGSDFQVFKPYLDNINLHLASASQTHNTRVVSVYRTFNGPSGIADPEAAGYISFVDNFHPSSRGHQTIGSILAELTPL